MCSGCSTELPMLAVPATGTAHVLVVRGTAVGGGVGVQVVIVVAVVVDGGGGGAAAAAAAAGAGAGAGVEKQAPTFFEHLPSDSMSGIYVQSLRNFLLGAGRVLCRSGRSWWNAGQSDWQYSSVSGELEKRKSLVVTEGGGHGQGEAA